MNAALMMFIVIGGVGGLANAFVNNYALFCVCRFVAAMGQSLRHYELARNIENHSFLPNLNL